MKRFWQFGVLGAGIAFFTWYLSRVGLDQVWAAAKRLGPFAPLILLPYLTVYLIDCVAWRWTLPASGISFLTLFRIRWAGESVNNVLPSAYVGGETVKVLLLRNHGVSGAEGATSAVVSKTAQSVAQLMFVLLASVILYKLAEGQPALQVAALGVVACGAAAIAALFWVQRFGFFRIVLSLWRILKLKSSTVERWKGRLLELDQTIFGFYRGHPGRFYASTGWYLGGWLLDSLEIYLIAYWLDLPIAWTQAMVVEAFTGVAKAAGMWVPGSLGVQESGIVLVGSVAGLPDTLSATYALIRRAREVVFSAAGLILLYSDGTLRRTPEANTATY